MITSRKNSVKNTRRRENSEMLNNLPKALEVYRAAWLILMKKKISIEEYDEQETDALQKHRPPTSHRPPTTNHRPTDRFSIDPPTTELPISAPSTHQPPTTDHQPTGKCSANQPTTNNQPLTN